MFSNAPRLKGKNFLFNHVTRSLLLVFWLGVLGTYSFLLHSTSCIFRQSYWFKSTPLTSSPLPFQYPPRIHRRIPALRAVHCSAISSTIRRTARCSSPTPECAEQPEPHPPASLALSRYIRLSPFLLACSPSRRHRHRYTATVNIMDSSSHATPNLSPTAAAVWGIEESKYSPSRSLSISALPWDPVSTCYTLSTSRSACTGSGREQSYESRSRKSC